MQDSLFPAKKPTVVIVSYSDITTDARVHRHVKTLSNYFMVVTVGIGPVKPAYALHHIEIQLQRSKLNRLWLSLLYYFQRYETFAFQRLEYPKIIESLSQFSPCAYILNDSSTWPLLQYIPAEQCIVDAHEFSPEELSDSLFWKLFHRPFRKWCSCFVKNAAVHLSVEQNICSLWEKFSGRRFLYLPNSCEYTPTPNKSHPTSKPIRVLHHGVAHPSRRIELMIEAISMLSSACTGSFLLTGSQTAYIHRLQSIASGSNCRILPPVPQCDLIAFSANYDVGILSIYPSNSNYRYCLPNKLFQFIQSRLPIVCGPTPSIAAIVRKYNIGVVADDFTPRALARALESLTSQQLVLMRRNLEYAASDLCWERHQDILINAVKTVANTPDA